MYVSLYCHSSCAGRGKQGQRIEVADAGHRLWTIHPARRRLDIRRPDFSCASAFLTYRHPYIRCSYISHRQLTASHCHLLNNHFDPSYQLDSFSTTQLQ